MVMETGRVFTVKKFGKPSTQKWRLLRLRTTQGAHLDKCHRAFALELEARRRENVSMWSTRAPEFTRQRSTTGHILGHPESTETQSGGRGELTMIGCISIFSLPMHYVRWEKHVLLQLS